MAITLLCFHGDWEAHALDCATDRPYCVRAAEELGETVAAMQVDFRLVCAILADFVCAEKNGNWMAEWTLGFLLHWGAKANFPADYTREQRRRVHDLLLRSNDSAILAVANVCVMWTWNQPRLAIDLPLREDWIRDPAL